MQIGVVFPQTEIGTDPGVVKEYIKAAESLGFSHMVAFDHVLGADTQFHTSLRGLYTLEDRFYEPFAFFSYAAAITKRMEFVTGILILPQRQTALVAKQAATLDVLSDGRFRMGIGTGWNFVEYQALGEDFHNRGRRSEEQIALMRALWTQDKVNFEGKWNRVVHAGIRPMPVQQPIPIWLGGSAPEVLDRVGRLGDGWITTTRDTKLGDEFKEKLEIIRTSAVKAGRDPSKIGLEAFIDTRDRAPEEWAAAVEKWEGYGATHVSLNSMKSGFRPSEHIDAIRRFSEALPPRPKVRRRTKARSGG